MESVVGAVEVAVEVALAIVAVVEAEDVACVPSAAAKTFVSAAGEVPSTPVAEVDVACGY